MKCVLSLNPDGTVSVTTPVALPGESDADALARTLADHPGGEPLSAELVQALRRADQPAAGAVIPVGEFRRRIYPITVALALSGDAAKQAKWDRLLAPLGSWSTITMTDPALPGLIQLAQADGLLTTEQAATVLEVG